MSGATTAAMTPEPAVNNKSAEDWAAEMLRDVMKRSVAEDPITVTTRAAMGEIPGIPGGLVRIFAYFLVAPSDLAEVYRELANVRLEPVQVVRKLGDLGILQQFANDGTMETIRSGGADGAKDPDALCWRMPESVRDALAESVLSKFGDEDRAMVCRVASYRSDPSHGREINRDALSEYTSLRDCWNRIAGALDVKASDHGVASELAIQMTRIYNGAGSFVDTLTASGPSAALSIARRQNADSEILLYVNTARLFRTLLAPDEISALDAVCVEAAQLRELLRRAEKDRQLLTDYVSRTALEEKIRKFLKNGADETWAMHLLGSGGVGKTMLMRRLSAQIAAECEYCTSRVDFDFLSPDYPQNDPGLLLRSFIWELTAQATGDHVGEIAQLFARAARQCDDARVSGAPGQEHELDVTSNQALRAGLESFANAVNLFPQGRVLLILDTCEELAKIRSADLEPPSITVTFQLLALLRSQAPGLRVLLAGRQPLASSGYKWRWAKRTALQERPFVRLVQVRGFNRSEAKAYLKLEDGSLLNTVLEKSPDQGSAFYVERDAEPDDGPLYNPVELQFFRGWVSSVPPPSAEEVAAFTSSAFVRDRIISRLPADGYIRSILPLMTLLGGVRATMAKTLWAERAKTHGFANGANASATPPDALWNLLCDQEWTSVRYEESESVVDVAPTYLRRLRDHYRDDPNGRREYADVATRIAPLLERLTLGDGPMEWAVFEAAVRIFDRTDATHAGAWWQRAEEKLWERGVEWVSRLTSHVLGPDGVAEDSALRSPLMAARASALLHLDDSSMQDAKVADASKLWQDAIAAADRVTLPSLKAETLLRSYVGLLILGKYAAESVDAESGRRTVAGLLAAYKAPLSADLYGLMVESLAIIADQASAFDGSDLVSSMLETLGAFEATTTVPTSILAYRRVIAERFNSSINRHALYDMLAPVASDLDYYPDERYLRHVPSLRYVRERASLEWLRSTAEPSAALALEDRLSALPADIVAMPSDPAQVRAWAENPTKRLVVAVALGIRRDLGRERPETYLPPNWRDIVWATLPTRAVRRLTDRLVSPLFVVLCELAAQAGFVEEAHSILSDLVITNRGPSYDVTRMHARRALLGLQFRYRLWDERQNTPTVDRTAYLIDGEAETAVDTFLFAQRDIQFGDPAQRDVARSAYGSDEVSKNPATTNADSSAPSADVVGRHSLTDRLWLEHNFTASIPAGRIAEDEPRIGKAFEASADPLAALMTTALAVLQFAATNSAREIPSAEACLQVFQANWSVLRANGKADAVPETWDAAMQKISSGNPGDIELMLSTWPWSTRPLAVRCLCAGAAIGNAKEGGRVHVTALLALRAWISRNYDPLPWDMTMTIRAIDIEVGLGASISTRFAIYVREHRLFVCILAALLLGPILLGVLLTYLAAYDLRPNAILDILKRNNVVAFAVSFLISAVTLPLHIFWRRLPLWCKIIDCMVIILSLACTAFAYVFSVGGGYIGGTLDSPEAICGCVVALSPIWIALSLSNIRYSRETNAIRHGAGVFLEGDGEPQSKVDPAKYAWVTSSPELLQYLELFHSPTPGKTARQARRWRPSISRPRLPLQFSMGASVHGPAWEVAFSAAMGLRTLPPERKNSRQNRWEAGKLLYYPRRTTLPPPVTNPHARFTGRAKIAGPADTGEMSAWLAAQWDQTLRRRRTLWQRMLGLGYFDFVAGGAETADLKSTPDRDIAILHLVGDAEIGSNGEPLFRLANGPRQGEVVLSQAVTLDERRRFTADQISAEYPALIACIVQAEPSWDDSSVLPKVARERTSAARTFAAQLHRTGVPVVVVLPPLGIRSMQRVLHALTAGLLCRHGRAAYALIEAVSRTRQETALSAESLKSAREIAHEVCLYAPAHWNAKVGALRRGHRRSTKTSSGASTEAS